MNMIAGAGFLEIVKWLHENGAICSTEAMDEASFNGFQAMIEWLDHNRTEGCTFSAMDGAAFQDHLGVTIWLHTHRLEGCSTVAMDAAAENGLLRIVIWLDDNRPEGCTPEAMNLAASNGFLNVVQWLHSHRSEGCTTDAMDSAAGIGDLVMVKWLHRNRLEGCTVQAMDEAATAGHLGMIQWLHAHRSEGCSTNAIRGAAANRHLEIMKWVYENKSQFCDEDMLAQAAVNGHLSVLKWLQVNHPSLFQHIPTVYIDPRHMDVILWLAENYPQQFPCDFKPLYRKPGPLALCEAWVESLPKHIDCDHSFIAEDGLLCIVPTELKEMPTGRYCTDAHTKRLVAVYAVCRRQSHLLALDHISDRFMEFLIDLERGSFEQATKARVPRILAWLIDHAHHSTTPHSLRALRYSLGILEAAKQGSTETIEAWRSYYEEGDTEVSRIYGVAVKMGNLNVLDWLLRRGVLRSDSATKMITSIAYSRLDVILWLRRHFDSLQLTISIDDVVAKANKDAIEVLTLVASNKAQFSIQDMAKAKAESAVRGNLTLLIWLHEHRMGRCCAWTLPIVAKGGYFAVVRWLYEQYFQYMLRPNSVWHELKQQCGSTWTGESDVNSMHPEMLQWVQLVNEAAIYVAKAGHLDTMELLLALTSARSELLDAAASGGSLEMVKWLHEKRLSCTFTAMDNAATNGHLSVVQWLHNNRSEGCTTDAMDGAVSGNHMDVVKWLHANRTEGCTEAAMHAAAASGRLDMVIWLRTQRPEVSTMLAVDVAAANGHLEVVKWLHSNRHERFCTMKIMDSVAANGHLHVLKWLHDHFSSITSSHASESYSDRRLRCFAVDGWGCTSEAMDQAAENGHLDVVQWLHANRSEGCSVNAMSMAARGGHLEVVRWLHENRSEGCSEHCVPFVIANGHLHVLKWMRSNLLHLLSSLVLPSMKICHVDVLIWLVEHFPTQVSVESVRERLQKELDYVDMSHSVCL